MLKITKRGNMISVNDKKFRLKQGDIKDLPELGLTLSLTLVRFQSGHFLRLKDGEFTVWNDGKFKLVFQPLLENEPPIRRFIREKLGISLIKKDFIVKSDGPVRWFIGRGHFVATDGEVRDLSITQLERTPLTGARQVEVRGGSFVMKAHRLGKRIFYDQLVARNVPDDQIVKALEEYLL